MGGASPAEFDRILVDADVTLGGPKLQLSRLNGFLPDGRSFVVLDALLPISGSFANVLSGQRLALSDGSGSFHVTYGFGAPDPTQVVLSAFQHNTNGDFDHDGDVDGRDFLVWQRGGSPNPLSPADLAAWKANFGAGGAASAASAVPEPSGALLALATISLACASRPAIRPRTGGRSSR
jgi:hypothetical protein